MKKLTALFLGTLLCMLTAAPVRAEDEYAYKFGPVTQITYVLTKPGKFDDYMKFLDTTYKTLMEANKEAGLILSYAVYGASPRNLQEPDLMLSVTYPNMAALDKIEEGDAVVAKVMGNLATQNKGAEDRESVRTILGSQIIRELKLK